MGAPPLAYAPDRRANPVPLAIGSANLSRANARAKNTRVAAGKNKTRYQNIPPRMQNRASVQPEDSVKISLCLQIKP
jgi:hypothetical protein